MAVITKSDWIADLDDMTCRNINNKITVCFDKNGDRINGRIRDMPANLKHNWEKFPNSQLLIQKAITEAEKHL